MSLKYDLFDALSAAIMNSEPIVIAEGKDDYQIYQTIANFANPKIQVYQVNEFENYQEGCIGVIKCLAILQPKFAERTDNIHKVMGIIDRDARHFRGEIPNLIGLFITKYYSIETYFATQENLRKLIREITYSAIQDVGNDILAFAQENFDISIETLYLLSLDALKNACVQGYSGKISYDLSPNKIAASDFLLITLPLLNAKKEELNAFADSMGLSIGNIKLIAKGKWYLYWFVNHTYTKIKELKRVCEIAQIKQCRSCKVGNYNDCLFKTKDIYRIDMLQQKLLCFIDEEECSDIIAAFQQLA